MAKSKTKTKAEKKKEQLTTKKPLLKIVFDGVIAVGPGHPDTEDGTRDGPFFGVMARSTRRMSDRSERIKKLAGGGRKRAGSAEEDLYIPTHVPTIFTLLKPTENSRPPDKVLQISPWHPRWYIWHPIRERLEFRFDDNSQPSTLDYLHEPVVQENYHGGHLPDGTLSIHGIELVPDMRNIWRDRCVLLDGLLSPDPNVNEKVLAQVLVPFGTVAGAGMLDKGTPLDVVFDPPRDLDEQEQLVPNTAVIVEANRVEIAAYSLDTGRQLDSIELDLTEAAEIWVSNGDPSDVELDMNKLASEIAIRIGGKREVTDDDKTNLEHFTHVFGFDGGGDRQALIGKILALFHNYGHVVNAGLIRDYGRAGNVDLDFELFYSLLKNEHLADDGEGLPVPKRPGPQDVFFGPNCLGCLTETNDKLYLKSNEDRNRRPERRRTQ
jgi:hypothetical protein